MLDIIAGLTCPENEQIVNGLLELCYFRHLSWSLMIPGVLYYIQGFDVLRHHIVKAVIMEVLAFPHMRTGSIRMVDAEVGVLHECLMCQVDGDSSLDHRGEVSEKGLVIVGLDSEAVYLLQVLMLVCAGGPLVLVLGVLLAIAILTDNLEDGLLRGVGDHNLRKPLASVYVGSDSGWLYLVKIFGERFDGVLKDDGPFVLVSRELATSGFGVPEYSVRCIRFEWLFDDNFRLLLNALALSDLSHALLIVFFGNYHNAICSDCVR